MNPVRFLAFGSMVYHHELKGLQGPLNARRELGAKTSYVNGGFDFLVKVHLGYNLLFRHFLKSLYFSRGVKAEIQGLKALPQGGAPLP